MSLPENDRTTWLASLTIGAEVAVDCTKYGEPVYRKGTVVKFTPKYVDVQAHYVEPIRFSRAGGWQVKGDRYHPMQIRPLDGVVRAVWQRQKALGAVQEIRWTKLPTDVLEQVLALVAGKESLS